VILKSDLTISQVGKSGIKIKQISTNNEVYCSTEKSMRRNAIVCLNMLKASESDAKQLGDIGEIIVAEYLNGTISDDPFDQNKDITLKDGTKVEVKTQSRWAQKNSFAVYKTMTNINIRKCVNVDRLIFVEIGREFKIRLYECTDRTYKTEYPNDSEAYLFDVNKMILLDEYEDIKKWCIMYTLSATDYRWLL
jgi:predicted transcriptional regulator